MPDPFYHTIALEDFSSASLAADDWEREVLPRLPQGWQEQAKELGAFSRSRQVSHPGDLLRGLLAYTLQGYSFRQLGAWSVLMEVGDLSEAAWRKRLRQSGRWLEWMLQEKLAASACQSPWLVGKGLRRVLLVDGTHLCCQGQHGQVWRVHTAYDLQAGRLSEVQVTDDKVGENWNRFDLQAGDLLVSDAANGYRGHIAFASSKQTDVVVRFSPRTLPLFDEQGHRIDVLRWLKGRHAPAGRVCSRTVWLQQPDGSEQQVRLVALRLSAEQTRASMRRKKIKAQQAKRKLQAETLYLAGWLLVVTSLPAQQWSDAEVLALYRARWHIELFFKRLKQLLDAHCVRCERPESARASILLFLLAWVLQEDELVQARLFLQEATACPEQRSAGCSLPEPEQGQAGAISEWMLAALSLDLLRQQVHGHICVARIRACLPRLQRFLRGSPRKRTHWYSQVCHWLRTPAA